MKVQVHRRDRLEGLSAWECNLSVFLFFIVWVQWLMTVKRNLRPESAYMVARAIAHATICQHIGPSQRQGSAAPIIHFPVTTAERYAREKSWKRRLLDV
ncbi:hypothetical protein ACTMU2_19980 [Cupriavidus basilensis]